jgi:hypothetical protein
MHGVVLSANGQSDALALQTTRETLQGLEIKGVILKVGEPNRKGTLYKVLLPEGIPFCRQKMVETQACPPSGGRSTRRRWRCVEGTGLRSSVRAPVH